MRPAFADPVQDSQTAFRAVLNAMARPGTIHTVTTPHAPPPPLDRATAAVLLSLIDADTPLWMDEPALAAREWAAFHCGTSLTAMADAKFAVLLSTLSLGNFCAGTDEEPESSATLILQVAALGEGAALRLEGPGLAAPTVLAVTGLNERFVADWQANGRLFPRGIDLILCAGDQLAALPRTVRLEPS